MTHQATEGARSTADLLSDDLAIAEAWLAVNGRPVTSVPVLVDALGGISFVEWLRARP